MHATGINFVSWGKTALCRSLFYAAVLKTKVYFILKNPRARNGVNGIRSLLAVDNSLYEFCMDISYHARAAYETCETKSH